MRNLLLALLLSLHAQAAPVTLTYAAATGVDPNLLSLDIYQPERPGPHPVMIFIHGGAWAIGDKATRPCGSDKARFYLDQGYIYVSLNYRLVPKVDYSTQVDDVARAIAFVREHIADYGGDPERIYLMGHSAGAHLAALVTLDVRRLAAVGQSPAILSGVILLDGAGYNIPELMGDGLNKRGQRLYQNAFGSSPEDWADASPTLHVKAGQPTPPFLIVCAGRQRSVSQSEELAGRLRQTGVSAEVKVYPDKSHRQVNLSAHQAGDPEAQAILRFLGLTQ